MIRAEHLERCLSHRNDIHAFILKMTGDEAVSEELLHEVILRAIEKSHQFEGRSDYKTWLIAIAKNEVYKRFREKKRELRRLEEIRRAENAKAAVAAPYAAEYELYIEQIKNGCLFALLHCLPFYQRCSFILTVLNNFPIESTASIIEKSQNATRILISRAKATIKRFLCDHCEYVSDKPKCRCVNMANFAISHGLVKKVEREKKIETVKRELNTLKDEVELLKTLPELRIVGIDGDGLKYRTIFAERLK